MPPKVKFTGEEMIAAALEIVEESGINAVSARSVAEKLGCSPRPIFTAFHNMAELEQGVLTAARARYNGYVSAGLETPVPFKGTGIGYIRFAIEHPRLFQLLFMTDRRQTPDVRGILPVIDENYARILASVRESYGLSKEQAERLYRHLWIYTHGIAVLCATRVCSFDENELDRMLTEVFSGILRQIRAEEHHD